MVPYMQSGEAIPSRDAGITPRAPSFLSCMEANIRCIFSLPNTEITDPKTIPKIQYPAIW
ncbi:hypothetical protein FACS189476_05750 [Spirochaetia bacterium]|nr:hypothetical protein FACS189476_05750 [Spirochaetia bacterium]